MTESQLMPTTSRQLARKSDKDESCAAKTKDTNDTTRQVSIDRCYLEITNRCNLNCTFCPGTKRKVGDLSDAEFEALTDQLRGHVRFLYFHLMGEPLLHPRLAFFVIRAREKGFVPIVTTNGTLLSRRHDLIEARPYKINISLHSHEGNGLSTPAAYLAHVMTFALAAARQGIIVVLRLWNKGGLDSLNPQLLHAIETYVPRPWQQRPDGYKLVPNLYIEYDTAFTWPDDEFPGKEEFHAEEAATPSRASHGGRLSSSNTQFCHALRNQIGILVDGTLVPCCLDHEGSIPLGNLHCQTLTDILATPRARALYDGFTRHQAVEPLCRTCGFARSRLPKEQ